MDIHLKPIGIISSHYKVKGDAPRQGRHSSTTSIITVFEEFVDALDGLKDIKQIFVLYWQDRASRDILKVAPHGKTDKRGVFSTRAPVRPNPIGLCLVEILSIDHNVLIVRGLDALDGSLLLDIKPFWNIDMPNI